MNKNAILLTENILNIFRKKNAGQTISDDELNAVIERFKELVKAPMQ